MLPRPALRDQTFGALVSHRLGVTDDSSGRGSLFPEAWSCAVRRWTGSACSRNVPCCRGERRRGIHRHRGISMENLQILVESSFGVEWDEISRQNETEEFGEL